jgi:hypothetical protein
MIAAIESRWSVATNLNHFRTPEYRVFLADPYFNINIKEEIRWNNEYLMKMEVYKEKPVLFHIQQKDGEITDERRRHFKEHVIESIPFHRNIQETLEQRLKNILKLVPSSKYWKLVRISLSVGGLPEYFVYDLVVKDFFFVAERLTDDRRRWIHQAQDVERLCSVVLLRHKT